MLYTPIVSPDPLSPASSISDSSLSPLSCQSVCFTCCHPRPPQSSALKTELSVFPFTIYSTALSSPLTCLCPLPSASNKPDSHFQRDSVFCNKYINFPSSTVQSSSQKLHLPASLLFINCSQSAITWYLDIPVYLPYSCEEVCALSTLPLQYHCFDITLVKKNETQNSYSSAHHYPDCSITHLIAGKFITINK